jgi:hypothetical protein
MMSLSVEKDLTSHELMVRPSGDDECSQAESLNIRDAGDQSMVILK